jgi:hypothetical protein
MQCSNNLHQLGLALHNYHDSNGCLPPYGFDFPTSPDPANVYGPQTMGHSALGLLLPYIEQGNIYNLVNVNYSVVDQNNLPPPMGTSTGGQTKIKVYQCPSAPERMSDYGPYFAQFVASMKGQQLLLATTDYAPVQGVSATFAGHCLPSGSVSGNTGILGTKGSKPRITDMTDGTSNTILFVEDAGRQDVYARGKVALTGLQAIAVDLNAAWADYNTKVTVQGFSGDGLVYQGGCCVVNCSNVSEIYAFHTAGANTLRGDGSVFFMKDSITPAILAALISANGGEVIPDY